MADTPDNKEHELSALKILQTQAISDAQAAGAEMFLGLPDAWYEPGPEYGCKNGHVSTRYLKCEDRGSLCLACQEPIAMLPHGFTDETLKLALSAIEAARRAPAIGAVPELPKLPKEVATVMSEYVGCGIRCGVAKWTMPAPADDVKLYTADQVEQIRRDAFEAGRRQGWFDGAGDAAELIGESESAGAQPADLAEAEPSPLYFDAVKIVKQHQHASVSLVQRRLGIGWNDARNMVEMMLSRGDVPLEWAPPVYQQHFAAPSPTQSGAQPQEGDSNENG